MSSEVYILVLTSFSIGFIHTLIGPDHYLPFVLLGKARNWTIQRTLTLTFLCGIGHVLGSVVLGVIGILGIISLNSITQVEVLRGDFASWALIGFGIAYTFWGLKNIHKSKSHNHLHSHSDYTHSHPHNHFNKHTHIHEDKKKVTPIFLFLIFVFGPCEPLIPILMVPASTFNWNTVMLVISAYGLSTVFVMLIIVFTLLKGANYFKFSFSEKYLHPLSGMIIASSGILIKVFGI